MKKKLASSVMATVAAAAILLSGTFAWQSINQTALNEASDVINPGGRLHDDFDGKNKDVYVENFADEPIFARIQLSEYFALIANKGIAGVEVTTVLAGGDDEATGTRRYDIHYFDRSNATDAYWKWHTGGQTVYMPTFNMNKDSLVADINGTYLGLDGIYTEEIDDDRYTDYKTYFAGQEEIGTEIRDADPNDFDEVGENFGDLSDYVSSGHIVTTGNTVHTAKQTGTARLIGMADWLEMVAEDGGYNAADHGSYWVYDTDGWVYWSGAIAPNSATGLLLTGIELEQVMDDSWYYAIHVAAQFVTADDIGKENNTGFYDPDGGTAPTEQAEQLLEIITGVQLRKMRAAYSENIQENQ